jgi:hypothetical protein
MLVKVAPALERVGDFAAFLDDEIDEVSAYATLRRAETIGRPVGDADWNYGDSLLNPQTHLAFRKWPACPACPASLLPALRIM